MASRSGASLIALGLLLLATPAFAQDQEARPGAEPARDAYLPSLSETALQFRLATGAPSPRGRVRLSLLSVPDGEQETDSGGVPFGIDRSRWTPFAGGLRSYEMSRGDCALKGLGAGASLGLWLGALAMTTDAWDERTSWYMAGAAAAAGTVLGGTIGVSSEAWRTNYKWDE